MYRRAVSVSVLVPVLLAPIACGGDGAAGSADARFYDAQSSDAQRADANDLSNCERLRLELQQYADEKIQDDVVVYAGLIVGVDTPACGTTVVSTGLAVVDPATSMTPDHLVPIGSITKTFVATVVLQLVEEGVLALDDTLSTWRTDVPNADSITIRQLLDMTSGVREYLEDGACRISCFTDPEHEWTVEELLACVEGSTPYPPGEGWHYANTNTALLGDIVETETGNPLHQEIRDRVLSPLGLDSTFAPWFEEPPGELTRGYAWSGTWTERHDNYSCFYAAGDLASSVADLLAWARALGTGATLQEETLEARMTFVGLDEPWSDDEIWELGYGLGVFLSHHADAGDVLGHPGALPGTAAAQMWYSPSWDSSAVLLVNHGISTLPEPNDWLLPLVSDLFAIAGEHR